MDKVVRTKIAIAAALAAAALVAVPAVSASAGTTNGITKTCARDQQVVFTWHQSPSGGSAIHYWKLPGSVYDMSSKNMGSGTYFTFYSGYAGAGAYVEGSNTISGFGATCYG